MKLLKKSEVAAAKAKDRALDVEEGMKLATKVDRLREVVSIEEAALEKFRGETLESIQTEIDTKSTERDALYAEVTELESRRINALRPLVARETAIQEKESELSEKSEAILRDRIELSVREEVNKSWEKDLIVRQGDLNTMHSKINDLVRDAGILNDEATRKHTLATQTLEQADIHKKQVSRSLEEREGWIAARETALSTKEEELRTKEVQLAKDWSLLKDRQATFDRNNKRN